MQNQNAICLTGEEMATLLGTSLSYIHKIWKLQEWPSLKSHSGQAGRPISLAPLSQLPDRIQIAWVEKSKISKKTAQIILEWPLRQKYYEERKKKWDGNSYGICPFARELLVQHFPEFSNLNAKEPDFFQPIAPQKSKKEPFQEEYTLIPLLKLQAAAGAGVENFDPEEAPKHLAFRKAWLHRNVQANPEGLVLVYAYGDSMEPTLMDQDVLLIDRTQKDPKNGKIFVIEVEGRLLVKRLELLVDGQVMLRSDNPLYTPQKLPTDEGVQIVGMVVWRGGRV